MVILAVIPKRPSVNGSVPELNQARKLISGILVKVVKRLTCSEQALVPKK